MKEYDIPVTIRKQYLFDLETHNDFCSDGYILEINKFTRQTNERQCPYCQKFNKQLFDGEIVVD